MKKKCVSEKKLVSLETNSPMKVEAARKSIGPNVCNIVIPTISRDKIEQVVVPFGVSNTKKLRNNHNSMSFDPFNKGQDRLLEINQGLFTQKRRNY